MPERSYAIRGKSVDLDPAALPVGKGITVRSGRRLLPGRARDGVSDEVDVKADELVRVELDNGFVLWSRADSLVREHGRRGLSRDGGVAWEFDVIAPSPASGGPSRGERGVLGLGIKVLDFFGVDVTEKAARGLGAWFEDKRLKAGPPGLYRCTLGDTFALVPLAADAPIAVDAGPILVFVHGTASSGEGAFGKLWAQGNEAGRSARERLGRLYGERAFAFEHRSITESPIANALALAERLPQGATLHLVSHSRGGLVGELLCLGECEDVDAVLTPALLKTVFAADRTIAEQLGLAPLLKDAAKARDDAYEDDRARLVKLLRVLRSKKFTVQRFVRVACPARGTTLASGRLDRFLSTLDFLAGRVSGEGLFADGLDFLLAVLKERTDPRTLPGLEAMMPGSALTRLLHHPDLVTRADLSVIAGDIEGDSLWQRIKLVATDWFYSSDHDLVVNTGSMSGGLRRPAKGARFREDKGGEVNHFAYFRNARSVQWLLAGLVRADDEDGGFLPIESAQHTAPRWREAVARSQRAGGARPLAVVVPGTLGSHLRAGGKHVWLNYWALLRGGLGDIAMGEADVVPDKLIDDFYGPLLEFLAHSHRVHMFAYDWRLSVRDSAAKLAEALEPWLAEAERDAQPVHIVAHSMGGLVVRAMIADGDRGAALWQRVARLPNSRFLMLGTPNLGSYEAVRWLTGFNPTQAKLSLLDFTRDTDDIVNLVGRYPGLLELLPFAPEDPDFAELARWQAIKSTTHARWKLADAAALQGARRTWQALRAAAPDPALMRYVAGSQPATVIDYQFADYEDLGWFHERKRLDFVASRDGDGTVTWASGRLPGVPMWYLDDTAHDALCVNKGAFAAYLELLQTGATSRLSASPPARKRAAAGEADTFILPATPPADGIPAAGQLRSLGFGGNLPDEAVDERPAVPTIELSVRHGDLSYARHPILVGHYQGDTIVSAEKALDMRLGGALTHRQQLGIYPGPLGTHALFFNDRAAGKPGGAIVVGLGQVGELTPGLLETGVRAALLEYALQVAQWADDRFGPPGSPRRAAVSCLLVGTGAGGMPIRNSVEAIVRGAVAANALLVAAEMDGRVSIDRLEFLELFEDLAILAAEGVHQILAVGELAAAVRWPAREVQRGRAGRRRVRFEEAPDWWHRLEIIAEGNRRDGLRFIFATDRARAEETLATGQLALAESFIAQASRSARANPEAARTLFEMLLPVALKEAAPRQGDMVLLVDECSARYPWELLENRWSDSERPPAVRAGLIRQLKTNVFRSTPAHAVEPRALVVGNPDLDGWQKFDDLPGARQEAQKVAALLAGRDWQVRDSIDEKTDSIIENLHRDAWRILHLAGHGEHEFALPVPLASGEPCDDEGAAQPRATKLVSGMVIGREAFLTPGDIEQMRWVPELVFINCCHLGRTQARGPGDRGALAANLGVQFIRMGVRAVVAAGWAVDDGAALTFAETFYARMLDGTPFGEAVRSAREATRERFPGVNTWGAYQCYGDPSFRLLRRAATGARSGAAAFSAAGELVAELDNLAAALKADPRTAGPEDDTTARIDAVLDRVPAPQRERWLQSADVCAALGLAWGEAQHWEEAMDWLERALNAAHGDCPVRVIEQHANFSARHAAESWLRLRAAGSPDAEKERASRHEIVRRAIAELDMLCSRAATAERFNLLGSAYKRLALLEADGKGRLAALTQMAARYRAAFEHDGKRSEIYPFANWGAAQLLALRLDPALAGPWQDELETEAARVAEALLRSHAEDPDFWGETGPADLDLVRLLASTMRAAAAPAAKGGRRRKGAQAAPPPAAAADADIDAIAARALATYLAAIRRGASPRELGSVLEHLDFIIEMLTADPAGDPTLTEAFVRVRKALQ